MVRSRLRASRIAAPPISAVTLLLACTASAPAATQLEPFDRTVSNTITFAGAGCTTPVTQSVKLPDGVTSAGDAFPPAGTSLFAAGNLNSIATVQSVTQSQNAMTWTATGAGGSCAAGNEQVPWESAVVTLRVHIVGQQRVLTRATVIARSEAICRSTARTGRPLVTSSQSPSTLRKVARLFRGAIRRLSALKIPRERSTSFAKFTAALDSAQRELGLTAGAIERGDNNATFVHVRLIVRASVALRSAAIRYGFPKTSTCAS